MFGVAFDGLDEVGDEVAAAFELHVDLRPGVFELVAQPDEAVVHAGNPAEQTEHKDKQYE